MSEEINATETVTPVEGASEPTLGNLEGTSPVENSSETPAVPEPETKPEEPKRENHDVRRLKKFMDKAAQLEAENLALKKQFQVIPGGRDEGDSEPQAPKREHFADDDSFIQAKIDYGIARAIPKIQDHISKNSARSSAEVSFQQREAEVRKQHPDYDEVVADAVDVRVPPIVVDAILTSDFGPDLRYYLAQNPEKAARLNSLPPASAARELGRIEAEIVSSKPAAPVVKVSKAPPPIRPVVGNGVMVETDLEKIPMDEYMKRRNEERRKLGKQY